jgi:hypothetical protein
LDAAPARNGTETRSGFLPLSSFLSRFRGWKRLKFLAWFEADGAAGRDIHLLPGARIATNSRLARSDVEDAEAAQLDAFTTSEGIFHGFEHSFNGLFGFASADIGFLHDGIYQIELDHNRLP